MVDKANCNCIYGRCEQIAAKNDEIERLRKYGSNEPVITHLKAENERLRADIEDLGRVNMAQSQRIASLEGLLLDYKDRLTGTDRINFERYIDKALAKEQDDRLSGERDQSVEGRDALNNDSALPAPDSKAKEQDDDT